MSKSKSAQFTDPLAQTFFVGNQFGVFLTKIGLFFSSKSSNLPVSIELRLAERGAPNTIEILPGSVATLNPGQVSVSSDGTAETVFEFDEPVYLFPEQQYAFCIRSSAVDDYKVYAAYVGDFVLGTTQKRITKNIESGSMYSSQSGLNYVAEKGADIKFNLYRAEFSTNPGTAVFKDANPPRELLAEDGLRSNSGTKTITAEMENHGYLVNDKVFINGLTAGTSYAGILGSDINGSKTITAVDGVSFSFDAGGSTNFTKSINFGGADISANKQYLFNTAQLQMQQLLPRNAAEISYSGDFTTSKSLAGTETSYATTSNVSLVNQTDVNFDAPHVILTDSNEAAHLSSNESSVITATLSQTAETNFISPLIDVQRAQMLAISNMIDRQDSAATVGFNVPISFVPETDPNNGTALSKHLTKPVTLEQGATGIKILFAGNSQFGTHFDMYYRTVELGSDSDINGISFIAAEPDTTMPNDQNEDTFKEYVYTIGGEFATELPEFNKYQVKVVMNSTNSSVVPRIRDLRTIALN
jgi:hypothetical protein